MADLGTADLREAVTEPAGVTQQAQGGRPPGASGPSYRLTPSDFPAVAECPLAGADEVSRRLGHLP